MNYTPQTVGAVIETLITVKYGLRGSLTFEQLEAINDACSILQHRISPSLTRYGAVEDHVRSVSWYRDDIRSQLVEMGYEGTEQEIDAVLRDEHYLRKNIDARCTEAGWEAIKTAVSEAAENGEIMIKKGEQA